MFDGVIRFNYLIIPKETPSKIRNQTLNIFSPVEFTATFRGRISGFLEHLPPHPESNAT